MQIRETWDKIRSSLVAELGVSDDRWNRDADQEPDAPHRTKRARLDTEGSKGAKNDDASSIEIREFRCASGTRFRR